MEVAEETLWFANRKVQTVIRPPYTIDFQVTAKSKYGDPVIEFDRSNFAPGSKHQSEIKLFANAVFRGRKTKGLTPNDAALLETLRQIIVCYIYRFEIFPGRKVKVPKGLTVFRLATNARRFLIAIRETGVNCISRLTPEAVDKVLQLVESSNESRLLYIDLFQDMIHMSSHGLLEPSLPSFEWEFSVTKSTKDTTAPRGKQALSEDQLQVLLVASIANINRARLLLVARFRGSNHIKRARRACRTMYG